MSDYKSLLKEKSREYDELSQQFTQFQQQSNLIINDLEEELKQIKRKNQLLTKEINQHKEKSKCFKSSIEREVELAQRERNQFKKKFVEFEKKVIELEIVNENLESELRATKSTLSQYQSRTQKTMEQLAIVRCEIQQTNQNNKEVVTRLKNQLKEAEEQLYAIHQIRQKKQQQKEKDKVNSLGQSEIAISELTLSNSNAFKQTLKGIREYMASLDNRKLQVRKMLLRV